jgi:membrane protein YdbS with pleckstrin-like domain
MDELIETESLKEQMGRIIEEARMMLPGIQALFGFQTIAVFSDRFERLPPYAQDCHATALALVVTAIALVVLPAAYHRLAEPGQVSRHAIKISSRAICYALAPLAAGLSLDIAVVLYMLAGHGPASAIGGLAAFVLLIALWFAYPLHARRRRRRHSY